jgi:hypothetical protein
MGITHHVLVALLGPNWFYVGQAGQSEQQLRCELAEWPSLAGQRERAWTVTIVSEEEAARRWGYDPATRIHIASRA